MEYPSRVANLADDTNPDSRTMLAVLARAGTSDADMAAMLVRISTTRQQFHNSLHRCSRVSPDAFCANSTIAGSPLRDPGRLEQIRIDRLL